MADEATAPEAPEWLRAYIGRLLSTFNLDGWRYDVFVLPQDELDQKSGPGTAACTDINDCYLDAHFYFLDSIVDDDYWREHILHEVLHCVLKPFNQAGAYFCRLVPKGRSSDLADAIWVDALEETVTRLTRAVAPLIDWSAE